MDSTFLNRLTLIWRTFTPAERDRSEWLLAKKELGVTDIHRCAADKEPEKLVADFAGAIAS